MAVSSQSSLKKYLPWIIGAAAVVVLGMMAAAMLLFLLVLRGNVVVTNLSLSQSSVTLGQDIGATVELKNQGWLAGKSHVAVTVDGQEKAGQDVTLKGRETQNITLNLADIPAGSHTICVADQTRDLKVLTPAHFEVASLTVEPASCLLGESATLRASIRNTGETAGSYTADVMMDGGSLPSPAAVPIEPGATGEVDIPLSSASPGSHVLELGNASAALQVLRPASIKATTLTTATKYIPVNQNAQATVTLYNAGDVEGTYTLTFLVNGKVQQTQDVVVKGQQTLDVPLTLLLPKAGQYELQVGEAPAQTVYAVQIGRPNNGTLLVKKANGGSGKLSLVNNYDQDAVFTLTSTNDPKTPLLSVFVRSKSKANNIKIKDGSYTVFYSLGSDFDTASKKFTKDASCYRFTDPVNFKTTSDNWYIYYSTWTITLNSGDGNAPTDTVPEDQFPN